MKLDSPPATSTNGPLPAPLEDGSGADDASRVLENLPLLSILGPEERRLVERSFVRVRFGFGSLIVQEGDPADAFYVLVGGRARVVKTGVDGGEVSLNVIRPGDYFGESGLLKRTVRTASVRASGDVELLRLDRSVFHALTQSHPELRAALELQDRYHSLNTFFRVHSAFARLPAEALRLIIEELEPVAVGPGELVIREGDDAGPMYVVEEGRLRAFREQDGRRQYRTYLRTGDFFGEMSLFQRSARTASVEAVSPCRLLALRPATFERLVRDYPDFKARIEEQIAQYDYKSTARVPLDFAEEVLPAEAGQRVVGPEQVDSPASDEAAGAKAGPFASAEGFFVKRPKRLRRFPHVAQVDAMDCGAASLAMVCRHFGKAVSLARIRQLVHTALDGTSLRGICHAATDLGLAARSVKATPAQLDKLPLPAIVHWDGNHWVVLYDMGKTSVQVADPALGLRRVPRAEFERKWSGYAALFDYTQAFDSAPEHTPSLTWLWAFFKPLKGVLSRVLALAVLVSVLQMATPVLTQVIVDRVLVEKDVGLLNTVILGMSGVLVFMLLAILVQRYLLSFAAVRIDAASLDFLTRRLLALPVSYFMNRRTGDIQRRLAGTRQVREFLVQNGVHALTASVQLVVVVVLMALYSRVLTVLFLAITPLYLVMMIFSRSVLRPIFHALEEGFGKYFSYQIDAIKGIETVKAMGAEGALRELMLGQFHGVAARQFKADYTMMVYDGAVQLVTCLSVVLFLWVGAYQVMDGVMTIGALMAFNALVAQGNGALNTLLPLWDSLQVVSVLLNRLNDIFENEPEQGHDHSQLRPVRTLEGRVRFQNLGFRYGGPESPTILEGITLDVPAGKMVAIVGRSGCGKTTLIKCLSGLLEPTEGTILYDGVDLKTLNYRDLRRQIGFVLQENYLFGDTIARNIAFGEDDPDMDRVLWAARMGNAHEFVERLPLGYETKIGESGIALSGGQRQRVAIARALYNRPPILIFDEATSALDTESERAVKQNLDALLRGRTSFVIAHRLSTVRDADLILVLEKGRVAEYGTHDELMKLQGLYYYLCSQQLGG